MTDDRSIERAARLWLEEGPTQAPDHAVRAALLEVQTTGQERRWPFPLGGRRFHLTMRTMAGIAVLAVVVVGGAYLLRPGPGPGPASESPGPTSTPTPFTSPPPTASPTAVAPPVLTSTFVSPRHGYAVQYPGDWATTPATASWEAGAVNPWGSPALDDLRGSSVRFVGASQALAPGQTSEQWLAAYSSASCIGPPETWSTVAIGAATGFIDADGCVAPGAPFSREGPLFDAVVIVGERAYAFSMSGELTLADFTAVLATITLDPASAVDATSSP